MHPRQRAEPSPAARVFGCREHAAKGIGRDPFEISYPVRVDQMRAVGGRREFSMGKTMVPFYAKSPAPKLVFASYFYSDSPHPCKPEQSYLTGKILSIARRAGRCPEPAYMLKSLYAANSY
jgi:hypothetical protein